MGRGVVEWQMFGESKVRDWWGKGGCRMASVWTE